MPWKPSRSRRARAAEPEPLAELLVLADGLPDVVESDRGPGRGVRGARRRRGPGRDRRRAGLGLPLLQPRLPDPAAPAGQPHRAWSTRSRSRASRRSRRSSRAPSGSCTPLPRTCPCLAELGLAPTELFDTELAGRLLGYPRVGLATLVETLLGFRMKKEHSAVDWSTRPLPRSWLEYAALDVEVLVELRELLGQQLVEAGKDHWARQEFDALRSFAPTPRVEAWRRTSGMHRVRGRRGLAAVRAMWEARDELAQSRDVTPGRIIPDAAIVAAAAAMPADRRTLLETKGFHGRGAERYATRWLSALREAEELARGRPPDPHRSGRRPAGPAGLGREGPRRRTSPRAGPRRGRRPGRGAPPAGRERAHPRLPPAHAVVAARDPRPRRPPRRRRRPARRARRPQLADRADLSR